MSKEASTVEEALKAVSNDAATVEEASKAVSKEAVTVEVVKNYLAAFKVDARVTEWLPIDEG